MYVVIKQNVMQGRGASSSTSSSRFKRCLIERERRLNMKNLFSRLSSILPPQPNKMSVPDLVDAAREYVQQKQNRIERLKETKIQLGKECKVGKTTLPKTRSIVINIRESDSSLEVNLVTRADFKFELREFLIVLEEEGAKVVSAMYHRAGDRFFCSIQSQAICSRIGIATSRVRERLEGLIS